MISLIELSSQVLDSLGYAKTGVSGIADIGGRFNPSDVIIDDSVPMRRLIRGVAGHHCIWLTVEYGGRGYHKKQLEYRLSEHDWVEVKISSPG